MTSLIRQSKRTERVEKKISDKIDSIDVELQRSTGLGSKLNASFEFIQPSSKYYLSVFKLI